MPDTGKPAERQTDNFLQGIAENVMTNQRVAEQRESQIDTKKTAQTAVQFAKAFLTGPIGTFWNKLSPASQEIVKARLTEGTVFQTTEPQQQYALESFTGRQMVNQQGFPIQVEMVNTPQEQDILLRPFREYVAPRLSAFWLAASPTYREANKDVAGNYVADVMSLSPLVPNSELFNRAIEDSKRPVDETNPYARIYSPMRSSLLFLSNLIPGKQGTEKLDWENGEEVNAYFNQGLPKIISGTGDFFYNFFDPANIALGAGSAAKLRYVTRPITSRNRAQVMKEIEDAKDPQIRNSWSELLDEVEVAAQDYNPSVLEWHPMINRANGANLGPVLIKAHINGGRELAADVLQVAIDGGASNKLADVMAKSQSLADEIMDLQSQERIMSQYVDDILDPNRRTAPLDSMQTFEQMVIPGTINKLPPTDAELAYATLLESTELTNLRNEIAKKTKESELLLEIQGTYGKAINQTVPVTALRKFEQKRILSNRRADASYWGISRRADGSRVAYWVNPANRLGEAPSGMAQLAGPAGDRSHLEIAARLRRTAKVTGQSPEWARAQYNTYRMANTKSSRWLTADAQLADMQVMVAAKHIPKVNQLDEKQLKLFRQIFEQLNVNTTQKRGQLIRYAAEREYTITVDGKGADIPQLKALIEDIAKAYADENGVSLQDAIKYVTDDIVRGTPGTESQVPLIHFAPSADMVEDYVISQKKTLSSVVDYILENEYDARTIKEVVDDAQRYAKDVPSSVSRTYTESGELFKDTLANAVLTYQDSFWKPLTLLGFTYTSRNIAEGFGRVAVLMSEFREERGYKYTNMLGDFTNAGRINRLVVNRKNAKLQKAQEDKFNTIFNERTSAMSKKQREGEETFLKANDSVTLSIQNFNDVRNGIENFAYGSPNQAKGIGIIRKSIGRLFKQDIPQGASKPFIDALLAGKWDEAWELSMSMDTLTVAESYKYIKSQADETLNELVFLMKKQGELTPSVAMMMSQIQKSLSNIATSADASMLALLNRAQLRGELEDLLASKLEFKKVRTGRRGSRIAEGTFQPVKGYDYPMSDAFFGPVNEIMLGQVSANSSTANTIFNVRQQIAQDVWNTYAKDKLIFPSYKVGNVYKMNPAWAEAFSEHANNIHYNDALSRLILEGKSREEIARWIDSQASVKWREALFEDAKRYPRRDDGKSAYHTIFDIRNEELNELYPLVGSNGEDLSWLRKKVLDRKVTPKDALRIPEIDRLPVNGIEVVRHQDDKLKIVQRRYRSLINGLFNALGTAPEDTFIRFPFYRMVYRNEIRRRMQEIVDAGKDPKLFEQEVYAAARAEAYTQVMQRLYSIERKTDLGQVMQFVEPFYMSRQNSARFWLGAAAKRPQAMVTALKIWNIPNRMGIVYDEDGNQVGFDTPWSVDDNQIMVGLPPSVAEYFGQKNLTAYKGTFDLAFQGMYPGVPALGGPSFDVVGSAIIRSLAGTKYDVDGFAEQIGLGSNFVSTKMVPFYKSTKDNPDENLAFTVLRGAFGYSAQYKPMIDAFSLMRDKPTIRAMAKVESIYRSDVGEAQLKGNWYTAEGHSEAMQRAYSQAIKGFLAEFLLANAGLIAKPKFQSRADEERKILNGYIKQYGYDQGTLKYSQERFVDEQNPMYQVALAVTGASDNRLGVFANTESISNLRKNIELVKGIDEQNPDSAAIGYLLNEGNPSKDYSATADEFLYRTKINNVPIKTVERNDERAIFNTQKRAFNNEYYPFAAEVDLIRAADAAAGNEQSDSFYENIKKQYKEELYQKYPSVGLRRNEFEKQDKMLDIRTIVAMLNDKTYMQTVGSRSKIAQLSDIYINDIRPMLVDMKKAGRETKVIDAFRNQRLKELSNGDPDVDKFFQIFFYYDDYSEIDKENVWGK